MKILLIGDSFSTRNDNPNSWTTKLSNEFSVTNLSQAGIGEYKILKQLEKSKWQKYLLTICSHTSPSRVHTKEHPLHKEGTHKNCDLIYSDIMDRTGFLNPALKTAQGWFKYHYDDQYQIDVYNLIRKKILDSVETNYLAISHVEALKDFVIEPNFLDFSEVWSKHRGNINHYTVEGNMLVYDAIISYINQHF